MKNEIKEILAYFEEYVKTTDMHYSEPMLNWKDLKIVLDYITNLQEENEDLLYYKKIIDKIIIIKDYPYKEDSDYILCNMSKQELYKMLCETRKRIYKGVGKDE